MFCPKCGNTIQPNETFCAACGTAVNQQPAAAAPAAEAKKANPLAGILENKKMLMIGAGALVAVILLIVLFSSIFSVHSSAEKVAKAYVEAFVTEDVEGELDLYPKFYLEYMADERYDMKEYDKDKLIRKIEKSRNWEKDDDVEIEFIEVEAKETKGKGDDKVKAKDVVKDFLKGIDCYEEYKNVDDAMFVTVGAEVDDEDGELTILCAKISGKWYVLD
ncbi:MAG: zinc-ribbon domain-containing protein [Ruminococcaceae bacterium]|nr:zinc-ribbon domain-containing protein [Oscillospiraceae bacterium]MBE6715152.1 zinc-ribbon domain-containing protein [Oscillospiraceae bacterium]